LPSSKIGSLATHLLKTKAEWLLKRPRGLLPIFVVKFLKEKYFDGNLGFRAKVRESLRGRIGFDYRIGCLKSMQGSLPLAQAE